MATGITWVLTLIAIGVVIGIIWMGRRLRVAWWALGAGHDPRRRAGQPGRPVLPRARARCSGHVVDFLLVGWWPVFNVADSAVVGGAILLVMLSLFGSSSSDGTRSREDSRA